MLYPDAQPQDKSSGRGTPAKPKKRPHANPHAAVPADFLTPAPPAQPKTPSYDPLSSIRPPRPKLTPRPATQPKAPSYDPLSSIRAPQSKAVPALVAPDRGKPKKKKPAQVTDENAPSPSGFPQDIEWQPDIDPADIFDLCGRLCEQNPQTMTSIMNFIEGFDPDDDEQTIRRRVNNHLRIIGLNDAFDRGDWYTTRLGPTVHLASSPSQNDAFADGNIGILQFDTLVAEAEATPQRINLASLDHLRKQVDDWDVTWTTEADLSRFVINKFASDYDVEVPDGFADDPVEDQVMKLLQFVHHYREAYYSKTGQYESPYPWHILERDYNDLLRLPELLDPRPLADPVALLDAFSFESETDAADYLRPKVEMIYAKLGHELPANWSESGNTVLLATMLHTGIEAMFIRHEADGAFLSDYDPSVIEFRNRYFSLGYSTLNEDYQRLSGTNQSSDYSLFVSLLRIFFEPADWALTTPEVIEAASRGDWGAALLDTGLLLLPGVSGSTDNLLRMTDELADLARRIDIDLHSLGTRNLIKRNDLINRGFPEQAVDDMISGKATLPMSGQGHGRAEGVLEAVNPGASRQQQMQIHAQNEVTQFLGGEGGYHVVSLGPNENNLFRDNLQHSINYRGTGNPDIVIMYRDKAGAMAAREFDIYSPVSSNNRTIVKSIKNKVRDTDTGAYKQADRIVLNLELTQIDVNLQSLKSRLERENTYFLKEVIIVDKVAGNYQITDVWTF